MQKHNNFKNNKEFIFGLYKNIFKVIEDVNNKNKNLKLKIYYMALKTMLQHIYSSFLVDDFKKKRY